MAVLVVEDTMRTVKVLVVVAGEENSVPRQGSSAPSKSQANVFTTPNARSAGKGRQSAAGEVLGGLDPTQENPEQFSTQETSPDDKHWSDPDEPNFVDDVEMPHPDDIEDPWKPLNPHEPGNLKIRPYMRDLKDDNRSNTGINFDDDDPDMPNDIDVDPDVPIYLDETIAATSNGTQDDIDTHASLDDLCQSHLDKNLSFDIGLYGEQILDTLSSRTDSTRTASCSEIVSGRPKYKVATKF
ncbi:unnamed protein product [Miscanthus lutarioriparius]|uniref:Uncharacterized protein n=1 Tax=Miscanthus lutarioriparius TaxID=422564 RepID=A0A811PY60_9POAL|nr:unnamed protein product [Miscanthus lutarioriparius]